jgi:hypothetical protein
MLTARLSASSEKSERSTGQRILLKPKLMRLLLVNAP